MEKISLFDILIYRPLGFLIQIIYDLVQNYGLAIILFTIVIKLILMPLQVKSQKAMKRQQKIQPIVAELQKKYANDQQRLSQEMMKVYKENNVSMTGGCLPLLIQFPILIGLYNIIRRPLTYIRGINFSDKSALEQVKELASKVGEKIPNMDQFIQNEQIKISTWANQHNITDWEINFDFLGLDLSQKPQFNSIF